MVFQKSRQTSRLLSIFLVAILATITQLAQAQTKGKPGATKKAPAIKRKATHSQYGFYFDPRSEQYFTNDKPYFSIRPVGNDRYLEKIEVSVDDGSFQTYEGKLNFSKEGSHSVRFRAVDPVLNWSPIQSYRIYVDLTPPETDPTWGGQHYRKGSELFIGPSASLILSAHDNLSGYSHVEYKRTPEGRPTIFQGKRTYTVEKSYSIRYAAVDNVGNREEWKQLDFTLDSTAPKTKVKVHGMTHAVGSTRYISSGGQIVLDSTDKGAGTQKIEYKLGNNPVTAYSQPISVSGKTVKMKFRSIDHVGNAEKWNEISLLVDNVPPTVNLQQVGQYVAVSGRIYAKSGFKLRAQVKDTGSGIGAILVSKNGSSFNPTKQKEFTFKEPGEYHFNLQAKDRVGNLAEANPFTVVIDTTAPVSEIHSTEPLIQRDGVNLSALPNRLRVSGVDSGVGIDRIEISYDGRNFTPLKGAVDLATWTSPKRKIFYRAVDRLGNAEKPKSLVVQVLRKGPKVDLFVESESLPKVPLSRLLKRKKKRIPAKTQ